MVDIIIPIYKKLPDEDDVISLNQVFEILGDYNITFVHASSLEITAYKKFSRAKFEMFNDYFFESIYGYNQLMLSSALYKRFSKKYILIYQTDAYVFKDELLEWVAKDYDYIGAPWLRSKEKIPFIKKIWDSGISFIKSKINFKENKNIQKDKSLLYNQIGNGGLSLRKRKKFIEVLDLLSDVVKIYLKPENQGSFYAEDVFFSIEPQRHRITFLKPNFKEACGFSIENKPDKAMIYTNGQLPFGCHRWNKESRGFWEKYFNHG